MIESPQTETQAVLQSMPDDKLTKTKTLYDVTVWEVIWRNFLAGMSRAVGSLLVYMALFFISGILLLRALMPILQPLLNTYVQSMDTLQQFNNTTHQALPFLAPQQTQSPNSPNNGNQTNPAGDTTSVNSQLQNLLNKLQQQQSQQPPQN